jgi:hypothetical protein
MLSICNALGQMAFGGDISANPAGVDLAFARNIVRTTCITLAVLRLLRVCV